MSTQTKPTLRELRTEAQRLGIKPDVGGNSIEELIRLARNQDDPMGWLAIHAPRAEAEPDDEQNPPVPPAEAACELAVDAENEPIEDVSASPPAAPRQLPTVEIVVPQADTDLTGRYVSNHVDVNNMSWRQSVALKRLHLALDAQNAQLANGRRAVTAPDAVRWLLEQIGED